jgi:signal transduction histidine kinase
MSDTSPTPEVLTAHDAAADVLALVNTRSARRVELLSRACEFTGADRAAALLWLWEAPWPSYGNEPPRPPFLALSRYASSVVNEAVPEPLLDLVASPLVEGIDCPEDPKCWTLGRKHQEALLQWAEQNRFSEHEVILPVVTVDELRHPQAIAFIQILSSSKIQQEAVRNIEIICGAMALLLIRSRDARKLECIQSLLRADHKGKQITDWLRIAADKLISTTHCEAALMFQETPDGFEATVTRGGSRPPARLIASAESVVTRIAESQGPVRLRDFADEHERFAAFGTKVHDEKLGDMMETHLLTGRVRSVILSPVIFEGHTLAVIALVNKKEDSHLARIFSKTDEEVLTNVCGFLKAVLPSIALHEALGAMARVVSPKTLEGSEEAAKVYEVLLKMVPAITGVGLIRQHRRDTRSTIEIFGGRLWTDDPSKLLNAIHALKPVEGDAGGNNYTVLPVPEVLNHYLVVVVKRSMMTDYERQILMFFATTLSPILLAEQGSEDVTENFAQLRHAVRTGIAGVVGYVEEAIECFQLYAKLQYAPSVLSQARFRKALERANYAAKTSQHLLEQPRFLLANITPESLRGGDHSVSAVVKSVLTTMKPLAEERDIRCIFNNRLRDPNERVHFDRFLIEMMIFNLIDNGIKYSFRDRPVTVTLDETKNDWRLSVVDHGARILATDMDAIFRPFTRRPVGPGREQRPGTGLGLAVARQVARAHGGDIHCTSEPGSGSASRTTFSVTVPKSPRGR